MRIIKGDMEKPPHQGHAWRTCIQIATHCHCSGEWAILWFFRIECTLLYRWRTQPSWPGTASVSRGVRAIRPESSVWKRQISPSHYFQPFKSTINPDEPILFYYSFHVPLPRQFYHLNVEFCSTCQEDFFSTNSVKLCIQISTPACRLSQLALRERISSINLPSQIAKRKG